MAQYERKISPHLDINALTFPMSFDVANGHTTRWELPKLIRIGSC